MLHLLPMAILLLLTLATDPEPPQELSIIESVDAFPHIHLSYLEKNGFGCFKWKSSQNEKHIMPSNTYLVLHVVDKRRQNRYAVTSMAFKNILYNDLKILFGINGQIVEHHELAQGLGFMGSLFQFNRHSLRNIRHGVRILVQIPSFMPYELDYISRSIPLSVDQQHMTRSISKQSKVPYVKSMGQTLYPQNIEPEVIDTDRYSFGIPFMPVYDLDDLNWPRFLQFEKDDGYATYGVKPDSTGQEVPVGYLNLYETGSQDFSTIEQSFLFGFNRNGYCDQSADTYIIGPDGKITTATAKFSTWNRNDNGFGVAVTPSRYEKAYAPGTNVLLYIPPHCLLTLISIQKKYSKITPYQHYLIETGNNPDIPLMGTPSWVYSPNGKIPKKQRHQFSKKSNPIRVYGLSKVNKG